ncbi:MAG: GNAT family N-acetyltransferase [Gammaproteobacteria bacterium]|nr:GNAT family N-acetyltransferase [Gammaproteobacteria bacterium]
MPTNQFDLPTPLYSERLSIRKVEETDIEDLLLVNGDERVTRFLPYETWLNQADGKAWLERMLGFMSEGNTLQFVIIEVATERVIGTCMLFRYDEGSRRAEIGYVMGHAHWRKGYSLEALTALIKYAFSELKLRRIEAEVEPDNVASNNLLLKLGFTCEGLLRERWSDYDTNIYGLLSHEWKPAD